MTIIFDFDGVLTSIKIQQLAKKMILEKNDVWVITKRRNDYNKEVLSVCNKIGLNITKIIYTNRKRKGELIVALNADLYIDNIQEEFEYLENTNTVGLLYI